MEEMFKTLPQHSCSWLKGRMTLYNYQGFWNIQPAHEGAIMAQQKFKARPTDVLLCSSPKTGTTWLKALAFAIVTREKFNEFNSPLHTALPHAFVPFIETELDKIEENHKKSIFSLVAAHAPYTSLPESVIASDCKIVYIYRNIKDVVVSNYHFWRDIFDVPVEDALFAEAFEEFCQGISVSGPYWDHILGYHYHKASLERPGRILLLKYEDLKMDATSNVKRLAEFIGYPFTIEEENSGMVEKIINLCSFKNLRNLEVNKSGKIHQKKAPVIENRLFFRKAKDGDWENCFTDEMKEKIDKLIDEKLAGTGLVLK